MAPQAQTLFSIALLLALSSLFAWKSRRGRGNRPIDNGGAEAMVRAEKIGKR